MEAAILAMLVSSVRSSVGPGLEAPRCCGQLLDLAGSSKAKQRRVAFKQSMLFREPECD